MEEKSRQNLSPTVPDRNIFEAGARDSSTTLGMTNEQMNKKAIIAKTTGGKKLPLRKVLVFLIIVTIILLIALGIKTIAIKNNQSGPVTLTWWGLMEDSDSVMPLINQYELNHPNVKIQFVSESQQDYQVRLMNSIAKNDGPDIFEFHNSWVPEVGSYLSPSKDNYTSVFYPVVESDLKTKLGFVGVPLEYDGIALFVNQDILQSFGKSPPKSWDDFNNLAQVFTIRDQNGNIRQSGAALGVTSNIDYWQDIVALLMLQNGADLANPNSLSGQSALTFLTNFSRSEHVWDETLPTSTIDFALGKVAMYFGRYSDLFTIQKQNPSFHLLITTLPQIPSNEASNPIFYANYWATGVSSKSANAKVAWDFLKFMTTSETLRQLNQNEKKNRGYGNLSPRIDMQKEFLADINAAPFIYEAGYAKSWYLNDKTFDGAAGINTLIAKPYSDAISALNGGSANADSVGSALQTGVLQALASYGLARVPVATP